MAATSQASAARMMCQRSASRCPMKVISPSGSLSRLRMRLKNRFLSEELVAKLIIGLQR